MEEACTAVQGKGCPLSSVWGFANSTLWHVSKGWPTIVLQWHMTIHALKFQSIVVPYGIVVHHFGLLEGRGMILLCYGKAVCGVTDGSFSNWCVQPVW